MSIIKDGIRLGAVAAVGFATFEVLHGVWTASLEIFSKKLKKTIEAKTEKIMNDIGEELKEKRKSSDSQPVDYSEVFMSSKQDDDLK